jgi:hypothetical protein
MLNSLKDRAAAPAPALGVQAPRAHPEAAPPLGRVHRGVLEVRAPVPPSDRPVLGVRTNRRSVDCPPRRRSYRDMYAVPRRLTAPYFEAALPLKSGSRLSWRHPCAHHRARSTAEGAPPPHPPPVTRPPLGALL